MPESPAPQQGILLTHFIVSDHIERSRRFLDERARRRGRTREEPTVVALANGWVTINAGGGPTGDKPTATLETPPTRTA